MKIAIVTQYYKPENAKISNTLAAGLASRGHSVRVVTAYPNFPEGVLYQGYRQKIAHVERDGEVQVKRVPIVISHSNNPFGRIANYLSFAFSSLQAGRYIANADVIYVYATQMTASIAPMIWSKTRRIPFVLHVQDLWPESVTGSSMVKGRLLGRLVDAILTPWLSATYRASAATIAIAPTMSRMLEARGAPADRLHVVYNWSDDEAVARNAPELIQAVRRRLTVTYAGNVGHLQDLNTIIKAVHRLSDLEGFKLVVVGSGLALPELRDLVAGLGILSVEFRDRVKPSEMAAVYDESDFQLVSLKNLEIFEGTIPSKFQASLAQGIPVISSVPGDVGQLVAVNGIGFAARAGDVDSVAQAFRNAYDLSPEDRMRMGRRARSYYEEWMTAQAGVDSIERILIDAVGKWRRLGR